MRALIVLKIARHSAGGQQLHAEPVSAATATTAAPSEAEITVPSGDAVEETSPPEPTVARRFSIQALRMTRFPQQRGAPPIVLHFPAPASPGSGSEGLISAKAKAPVEPGDGTPSDS